MLKYLGSHVRPHTFHLRDIRIFSVSLSGPVFISVVAYASQHRRLKKLVRSYKASNNPPSRLRCIGSANSQPTVHETKRSIRSLPARTLSK
jgi:hypothetical protein